MGASIQAIAQDDDPIKVGILHSLSGTMATSETVQLTSIDPRNRLAAGIHMPWQAEAGVAFQFGNHLGAQQ